MVFAFFEEYDIAVQQLDRTYLQSEMIGTENFGIEFDDIDEEKQEEVAAEKFVRDTVVALAANPKSLDYFYLIKFTEEQKEKTEDVAYGFGQVIKKRTKHFEGVFVERKFDSDNIHSVSKKLKSALFFKDSVVSPLVELELKKETF